ncbi:MAG: hypothetical protein JSS11_16460 [Verrucomicrobia bacterium]|nr:hypothetical protein [Verrucomicrobiota bacterium]
MNPAELNALHIFHVVAAIVMIAFTFFAFAGPADTRKRVLMITGIASLLVLLTGIRMWQGMFGFSAMAWIFIKMACWLGLSALTGLAYRKRESANTLMVIALILAIVAVTVVYVKPAF